MANSLDVETEKIIDEIFNKQINKTIIFVSHKKKTLNIVIVFMKLKRKS